MKIFIKYVLKSMVEKKGRFILLLLAIAISTGLVVTSTGLINILLDSLISPQLETFEKKDIVINPKESNSNFFSVNGINLSGIDENSVLKEILMGGMVTDHVNTDDETMLSITIHGRETKDINKDILTKGKLDNFNGEVCIISERTSKERNLKIGDQFSTIIGGVTKNLKIIAISASSGMFYNDSKTSFAIVVPYVYLSKDMKQEGKYNMILANSSEKTLEKGIEKFNENNKLFTAEKLFDEKSLTNQLSSFKSILYVMLIVVVVMSAIIIYSSFKLIITERLSTIGTFLSQGATVRKVKAILHLESLIYGIFGSIFGNLIGILGLLIISRLTSPLKDYGIYGKLTIEPYYIITGILFAILLSLLASYIPVRNISKLQVKDIILNDVRISKTIGWKKFIVGSILLLISVVLYMIQKENLKGFAALLIVISLTGVIFAYPKVIDLISKLLYRLLRGKSKSVIYAINNLRTSNILLGNISLIIISLTSIITITSLGKSMINVVTEAYTKLEYDIEISDISTIRENEKETTADYLVKELVNLGIEKKKINLVNYQYGAINDKKKSDISVAMMAINPETYVNYNHYLKLNKKQYKQYLKDLTNDNSGVIITTALNKQLKKKIGESILITCNGVKKELHIVGIIDGKLYDNGYFILLHSNTMSKQYGLAAANSITFSTDKNADKVLSEIKPIIRKVGASAMTRDEMCKENVRNNKTFVKTLSFFSYIAIVIAALGIVNNVLISFLQRKSEFAVLESVGLENTGRTKIIYFESIASVTWAMLITAIYSVFELKLASIMTKAIGFDMSISLDYKSLPMIYFISLAIVLVATIPVYFRSRKLSIIQELKYE